jgi:hypothetical protein
MLVFPTDLKKVEEVCCGGVDGNQVFAGLWRWVGEVDYFEVLGALFVFVNWGTLKRKLFELR